jgi:hypothetical protein
MSDRSDAYTNPDPASGPKAPATDNAVSVEVLSGAQLQSAVAVLPAGVPPHVMTAVRISSSSTDEPTEARQILYWQCVGGTITVHIGHTDPAAAMSVYDGSVPTSIPCGSS